jgi:hypothetical protein
MMRAMTCNSEQVLPRFGRGLRRRTIPPAAVLFCGNYVHVHIRRPAQTQKNALSQSHGWQTQTHNVSFVSSTPVTHPIPSYQLVTITFPAQRFRTATRFLQTPTTACVCGHFVFGWVSPCKCFCHVSQHAHTHFGSDRDTHARTHTRSRAGAHTHAHAPAQDAVQDPPIRDGADLHLVPEQLGGAWAWA